MKKELLSNNMHYYLLDKNIKVITLFYQKNTIDNINQKNYWSNILNIICQ